jgi:hypothetical protein
MGKPMAKWRRTYESRMRASVVTHYEKETEDGFLLLAGKDGWAGGFIWECQAEGKVLSCSKTHGSCPLRSLRRGDGAFALTDLYGSIPPAWYRAVFRDRRIGLPILTFSARNATDGIGHA